ncbi:MAG: hypothetical protein PHV98_00715 [Candidatus Omnitrophica bacterium]|nr:hypothetical protein [Candidatus Omnitrophota bacterium]
MGKIRLGIPEKLALKIRDEFGIQTFIETGTYKAGTTTWASQNFKRVISIEGYEEYYDKAVKICADYPNIKLLYGDSREKLPLALSKLKKPALIWLDAHWLGNVEMSSGTEGECPLEKELEAIKNFNQKHIILIDDAHCFLGDLPDKADKNLWMTYQQIENFMKDMGYFTIIHEDVIIAAPFEHEKKIKEFIEIPGIKVVVLTSNDYVHCVPAFAYLFNKFWSPKQQVTIARYEIRPPKVADNFYRPCIGQQSHFTWSSGLLEFLKGYNSELILLMLEDYFLIEQVDTYTINELWQFMLDNPEVVKVDLSDDRLKYSHEDFLIKLIKSDDDSEWQTSLQAAIWRVDFLKRFLNPAENAWQFEKEGTKRVIAARQAKGFDGLILGTKNPPMKYINAIGGHGTNPGNYDFKKFPGWLKRELMEKRLI